jgi:dynein heavy chain
VVVQCDEDDTLYDFLVRSDGSGWQHWREKVPDWIYPKHEENPKYSQLIIPTMDSVRYEKLFSLLHSVNKVRLPCSRG